VIDGRAFAVTPAGVVPAGGPPIHTVQPGDTLFDIARSQYGSGSYYTDIARRNHVPNPDLIHPGQTVVLPPVDPNQPTPPSPPPPVPRPAAPAASSPAPHASAAYDVRDHDSLWSIARRAYGDGSRWGDIARANHLHGTTIRQGERLWIPPLAGAARH